MCMFPRGCAKKGQWGERERSLASKAHCPCVNGPEGMLAPEGQSLLSMVGLSRISVGETSLGLWQDVLIHLEVAKT